MDFIKKAWDQQAVDFKSSHAASWKDLYAINLEIEVIGKNIRKGDVVLDAGCANGYSAFRQLERKPSKIVGIDFSEKMISFANSEKANRYPHENIFFETADIRDLKFPDGQFDVVYTTRVLINLPNWEDQQEGIQQCLRVLKKGGRLIISEAFWEPLVKLNALRTVCGLPSLVEHDFNRYIKKEKLQEFLTREKLAFENIEFSSLYYLGTRFFRDLVTDLEDRDNYQNTINTLFYDLETKYSGKSDFGIQQAFIVHK